MTRPRGWHLPEKHLTIDGAPLVGALVDFGLYFFHNAAELLARGAGPAFYLPKLESHLEARLWADVFAFAEAALGIEPGSIRATVLIETIWAAFEMDEILYELRDYAAGLNAGRWDYLFSIVKTFRDAGPGFRAAGPEHHHHGRAVHEGLLGPAGRHLPPARCLCDRRDGGLHPVPARPGDQRGGLRQGARRQDQGGRRRLRGLLGGPSRTWCRSAGRSSTPRWASGSTSWTRPCRPCMSPPRTCWTSVRCR